MAFEHNLLYKNLGFVLVLLVFLFTLQLRFKRDVNIWHSYGEAIQKFSTFGFASALAYAVWWVLYGIVKCCGENWDLTIWKMTVAWTDYCVHNFDFTTMYTVASAKRFFLNFIQE